MYVNVIHTQVHKRWKTDEWFGAQRLVGANPMSIQLCTEISDTWVNNWNYPNLSSVIK